MKPTRKAANPGVQEGQSVVRSRRLVVLAAVLLAAAFARPAQGQVLKTGQTKCWNSAGTEITCTGTGQDGELQKGVARSYTDNGDGTITDNVTGLIWEKLGHSDFIANYSDLHDVDNSYSTWALAFQKIADLNTAQFAGYSDWRLPNVKELQSLVFFGRSAPAIDSAFNNGTDSFTRSTGTYWSSTTFQNLASQAYAVSFTVGGGSLNFKTSATNLFVRAVRDPVTAGARVLSWVSASAAKPRRAFVPEPWRSPAPIAASRAITRGLKTTSSRRWQSRSPHLARRQKKRPRRATILPCCTNTGDASTTG